MVSVCSPQLVVAQLVVVSVCSPSISRYVRRTYGVYTMYERSHWHENCSCQS